MVHIGTRNYLYTGRVVVGWGGVGWAGLGWGGVGGWAERVEPLKQGCGKNIYIRVHTAMARREPHHKFPGRVGWEKAWKFSSPAPAFTRAVVRLPLWRRFS